MGINTMIELIIAACVIAVLAIALIIEDIRRWRKYLNDVKRKRHGN